jgi:hypothetical protein
MVTFAVRADMLGGNAAGRREEAKGRVESGGQNQGSFVK